MNIPCAANDAANGAANDAANGVAADRKGTLCTSKFKLHLLGGSSVTTVYAPPCLQVEAAILIEREFRLHAD